MKWLIIIERDVITMRRMKSGPRPMVGAAGRLYRVDDGMMLGDIRSSDAIAIYPIDSTQPMTAAGEYVDPDMTKILIDSAKIAGKKKSLWTNLDDVIGTLTKVLIAVVICGAMIMTIGGML